MVDDESWASLATERIADIRNLLSASPLTMTARQLRDAEVRKTLTRIDAAADAALGLCRRADEERRSKLEQMASDRLAKLLDFEPARERLDALIERADQLDSLLIECADHLYLAMELQSALSYEGTALGWDALYDKSEGEALLHRLLDDTDEADHDLEERVRGRLLALRWTRSDHYRRHRARLRMKVLHLWLMAIPLAALVGLLGLLVQAQLDGGSVALGAVSGALGATMSGAYRLRDDLERGSDLREFRPALIVQPLLGAAAALFILLVLESGLLQLGGDPGWAMWAAVGFVAGFSEPFVLGVVRRVAG